MPPLWEDLGPVNELKRRPLSQLTVGRTRIALSYAGGKFGAVSGICNHAGGPLGDGRLEGEYIVCPWHHWKFHCISGVGEPGYEEDRVPSYTLKEEDGRLLIDLGSATKRGKAYHPVHTLEREVKREAGPVRVVGISCTIMDPAYPRFSASDCLLTEALRHAASRGSETRMIRLNDLRFRACEGYYSKSAHACTWPCSITQMDPADQMDQVYEAVVFWADVILIATPIRWGGPSSLYVKMVERMNCIQNQITIRNRVMLMNKVAAFVIVGGQDNVQSVAGQMMMFFGEVGCVFPQFPFIAHSRGWEAEDMERNVQIVMESQELREGARGLVDRSIEMADRLLGEGTAAKVMRGGRKASAHSDRTDSATVEG
jgi:multimeric flavodoxin WrbA/nitrite reductase/ring-hydroxylating ferredoxin subunit